MTRNGEVQGARIFQAARNELGFLSWAPVEIDPPRASNGASRILVHGKLAKGTDNLGRS